MSSQISETERKKWHAFAARQEVYILAELRYKYVCVYMGLLGASIHEACFAPFCLVHARGVPPAKSVELMVGDFTMLGVLGLT